ncbi:MAG: AAA family ATPase [Dysosmobacter sp.]
MTNISLPSNGYLATLLAPLRMSYDYIIVDTNPSLGSLTINALTAADEVIIPIDPELFALTGLQALMDMILVRLLQVLQQNTFPSL